MSSKSIGVSSYFEWLIEHKENREKELNTH